VALTPADRPAAVEVILARLERRKSEPSLGSNTQDALWPIVPASQPLESVDAPPVREVRGSAKTGWSWAIALILAAVGLAAAVAVLSSRVDRPQASAPTVVVAKADNTAKPATSPPAGPTLAPATPLPAAPATPAPAAPAPTPPAEPPGVPARVPTATPGPAPTPPVATQGTAPTPPAPPAPQPPAVSYPAKGGAHAAPSSPKSAQPSPRVRMARARAAYSRSNDAFEADWRTATNFERSGSCDPNLRCGTESCGSLLRRALGHAAFAETIFDEQDDLQPTVKVAASAEAALDRQEQARDAVARALATFRRSCR
jgi:hypothetical protein